MTSLLLRLGLSTIPRSLGRIRTWFFPPGRPAPYSAHQRGQRSRTLVVVALGIAVLAALYAGLRAQALAHELEGTKAALAARTAQMSEYGRAARRAHAASVADVVDDLVGVIDDALGQVARIESGAQARATSTVDEHLALMRIQDEVMERAVPQALVGLLAPPSGGAGDPR